MGVKRHLNVTPPTTLISMGYRADRHRDPSPTNNKTSVLLLGSRNNPDAPMSMNIVTVLEKCDREYPGLMALYAELSESSHPSYEGLCRGYSKVDHGEYETHFSNRWAELYSPRHMNQMHLCLETFHHEYNTIWPDLMTKLETWIEINDERLEAAKDES